MADRRDVAREDNTPGPSNLISPMTPATRLLNANLAVSCSVCVALLSPWSFHNFSMTWFAFTFLYDDHKRIFPFLFSCFCSTIGS